MEKYWEQNTDIHHLFFFFYFQAAYDTLWRKEIRSEVHKLRFHPKKLAKLSRIISNEIYAKVKICKHLSSELEVDKVLRQ